MDTMKPTSSCFFGSSQEACEQDAEYQAEENKVIAHECAHMSGGGGLCGCASYTYELKDNGKAYIVAGEVPISMPNDCDPEVTMGAMQIVINSALAPADPSGQDTAVAGEAFAKMAEAIVKLAEKNNSDKPESRSVFDNMPVFS
jgi:hypothetical protein